MVIEKGRGNHTHKTLSKAHPVVKGRSSHTHKTIPKAHQVQFVLVFCVVFQHVYVSVQTKEMVYICHGLVVWHVPHKQLYLGGLWLGGLPAATCGRERGPVTRHLVDGVDPFGLGESRGRGSTGGGGGVCSTRENQNNNNLRF